MKMLMTPKSLSQLLLMFYIPLLLLTDTFLMMMTLTIIVLNHKSQRALRHFEMWCDGQLQILDQLKSVTSHIMQSDVVYYIKIWNRKRRMHGFLCVWGTVWLFFDKKRCSAQRNLVSVTSSFCFSFRMISWWDAVRWEVAVTDSLLKKKKYVKRKINQWKIRRYLTYLSAFDVCTKSLKMFWLMERVRTKIFTPFPRSLMYIFWFYYFAFLF